MAESQSGGMGIQFEWDDDKAASNLERHGVNFEEATTVFRDPFALIFDDEAHSIDERRGVIIGHSTRNRLLLVCFTERQTLVSSVPAPPHARNVKTMNDTLTSEAHGSGEDEMLPEYDFDSRKAGPNRFALRGEGGHLMVVLDPDVAQVFNTSAAVNAVLPALITAMPRMRSAGRQSLISAYVGLAHE